MRRVTAGESGEFLRIYVVLSKDDRASNNLLRRRWKGMKQRVEVQPSTSFSPSLGCSQASPPFSSLISPADR
jgi:hypothetical protein